jgi:hypothetical protein
MIYTIIKALLFGVVSTLIWILGAAYFIPGSSVASHDPWVAGYLFMAGFAEALAIQIAHGPTIANKTRPAGNSGADFLLGFFFAIAALASTASFGLMAIAIGMNNIGVMIGHEWLNDLSLLNIVGFGSLGLSLFGLVWLSGVSIRPKDFEEAYYFLNGKMLTEGNLPFCWWSYPKIDVLKVEQEFYFNFPNSPNNDKLRISYEIPGFPTFSYWPTVVKAKIKGITAKSFNPKVNLDSIKESLRLAAKERARADLTGVENFFRVIQGKFGAEAKSYQSSNEQVTVDCDYQTARVWPNRPNRMIVSAEAQ